MSYTTAGVTDVRTIESDGALIVQARSAHGDKVVQCYVAGKLLDWQEAPSELANFVLAGVNEFDLIFLLAVDTDQAQTNYWDQAFGVSADYGNRILLRTPQTVAYLPGHRWRVHLGDAGDAEATRLAWDRDFYPGGRHCGGFGFNFGDGGFGWDGYDCKGFGYYFGYGEFGYDCDMIKALSEPLPPGTYPYEVNISDEGGNESSGTTGTVTLDTYARPAAGLAVSSYTKATDTLALTWTASEDIS